MAQRENIQTPINMLVCSVLLPERFNAVLYHPTSCTFGTLQMRRLRAFARDSPEPLRNRSFRRTHAHTNSENFNGLILILNYIILFDFFQYRMCTKYHSYLPYIEAKCQNRPISYADTDSFSPDKNIRLSQMRQPYSGNAR